jgi:hypothetical protein
MRRKPTLTRHRRRERDWLIAAAIIGGALLSLIAVVALAMQ